jgi:hypothetical protein
MAKNKTLRNSKDFEELYRLTSSLPSKYAIAAKKIVKEGLIEAFDSQMIECIVKVQALHNGTLAVEVSESTKKAYKEQRNFFLRFNLHGQAFRNLSYYGPTIKQERMDTSVYSNRDVNLNVGAFTNRMAIRREKIRNYADELMYAATQIQQHDRNVESALQIFVRDTVQTLYKKVVF